MYFIVTEVGSSASKIMDIIEKENGKVKKGLPIEMFDDYELKISEGEFFKVIRFLENNTTGLISYGYECYSF